MNDLLDAMNSVPSFTASVGGQPEPMTCAEMVGALAMTDMLQAATFATANAHRPNALCVVRFVGGEGDTYNFEIDVHESDE